MIPWIAAIPFMTPIELLVFEQIVRKFMVGRLRLIKIFLLINALVVVRNDMSIGWYAISKMFSMLMDM